MHHRLALPLAAFLIGQAACSGCNTQVVSAHGEPSVSPLVADFDQICLNSTAEFDVMLDNIGAATLNVAVTFDNPAFALVAPAPSTLPAHESITLRVGFTPTTVMPYSGFMTITTNAEKNATLQVTLTGTGFNGPNRNFEVSCLCDFPDGGGITECGLTGSGHTFMQPCHFLTYSNDPAGTPAPRTVTVTNYGCESLTFTQATFGDTQDSAQNQSLYPTWYQFDPGATEPAPPTTLASQASQDYVVQFSPPAGAGTVTPIVFLDLASDDPNLHSDAGQTIAGAWQLGLLANTVEPALSVSPPVVSFDDAVDGEPDTKSFTVQNNGSAELAVMLSISGSSEFQLGSTMVMVPANSSQPVGVTFTATGSGPESAIVTASGAGVTQQVELVGGTQPQVTPTWLDPAMSHMPEPPPVNWMETATGDTNDPRTVRLTNSGTAPLTITQVVARDPTNTTASTSFSVTGFSQTMLLPTKDVDVTVVFNDDIYIRNNAGTLVIYSNDPAAVLNGGYTIVGLETQDEPAYRPIPNISISASPTTCKALTLDGTGSTDPQGQALTYQWSIMSAPSGSQATLSTPTSGTTNVVSPSCPGPDLAGTYVFTLTVADTYPGNTGSVNQTVSVQ